MEGSRAWLAELLQLGGDMFRRFRIPILLNSHTLKSSKSSIRQLTPRSLLKE